MKIKNLWKFITYFTMKTDINITNQCNMTGHHCQLLEE